MMLSELTLNDTNLLVFHSSRLTLFPLIFILFEHNPFFALSWSGLGLGKALCVRLEFQNIKKKNQFLLFLFEAASCIILILT